MEEKEDDFHIDVPRLAKFRLPLALTIVGVTLLASGIYFTIYKNDNQDIKFSSDSVASGSADIFVHLSGAVTNPGVYRMRTGSRINDLIEKAGGFTSEASSEFIDKTLNLAQTLKDGLKIYIPSTVEEKKGMVAGKETTHLVNINNASQKDLEDLSGIGPVSAQKIIENRPYSTVEELVERKIINQGTFEKIREKIAIF